MRRLLILAGVAVLVAGCGAARSAPSPVPTSVPTARTTPTPEVAWYPDGFRLAPGDPSIAWEWIQDPPCSYSGARCLGMSVIPKDGCSSSLYVELSVRDAAGTAIGYTNDSIGAVAAGQQARLIFDIFEDGAKDGLPTEFSCY